MHRALTMEILALTVFCLGFGTPSPPDSLREAAQRSGMLVGTAVRPAQLTEAAYAATLAREFNMLEPEDAMKWEVMRPSQTRSTLRRRTDWSISPPAMT